MGVGGVLLAALAEVLAVPLAHIFVGYDKTLFDLTVHAFRLYSFVFVFSGINIFSSGFSPRSTTDSFPRYSRFCALSFSDDFRVPSACVVQSRRNMVRNDCNRSVRVHDGGVLPRLYAKKYNY